MPESNRLFWQDGAPPMTVVGKMSTRERILSARHIFVLPESQTAERDPKHNPLDETRTIDVHLVHLRSSPMMREPMSLPIFNSPFARVKMGNAAALTQRAAHMPTSVEMNESPVRRL